MYSEIFNHFKTSTGGLHLTSSKHDYANYGRFVPNFGMAYKTIKRVSVPNVKSFGPTRTELRAKEFEEFSIMLHRKMGWGVLLPIIVAAAI